MYKIYDTDSTPLHAASFKKPSLPSLDLDSYKHNSYLTHGIHPYPAKFVPQIPRRIIEALSPPGGTVLDPFCGSGTTLLEAMLHGSKAIGTDSNLLAVKIAQAKTTLLDERVLAEFRDWIDILKTANYSSAEKNYLSKNQVIIPDFKNRSHWFTDESCIDLGLIKGLIENVEDLSLKNLLEVAFSSIIVKASRQDSDTRWCAVDKNYKTGDALALMISKTENLYSTFFELLPTLDQYIRPEIICCDVRKMDSIKDGEVDLIVTSPPYLNSFDYYLYHKLRMFWLGIDHYPIQEAEIGSRNKHCDKKQGVEVFMESMKECTAEFRRVAKNDGMAAIVVGDSVYKGELIEMDDIYNSLMTASGFHLADKFSYDQRKYTRAFTPKMKTMHKKTHILLYKS